jgi:hypothetical protein
MRVEATPKFGSDVNLLGPLPDHLADEALATSVAINVGGVDEIDARIDGFMKGL